jgi:hypothetical protein
MDFHKTPHFGNMMSFKPTPDFPVFPHTKPATLILYKIISYQRGLKREPSKMYNFPALVNSRKVFGQKYYSMNFSLVNLVLLIAAFLGPYSAGLMQAHGGFIPKSY